MRERIQQLAPAMGPIQVVNVIEQINLLISVFEASSKQKAREVVENKLKRQSNLPNNHNDKVQGPMDQESNISLKEMLTSIQNLSKHFNETKIRLTKLENGSARQHIAPAGGATKRNGGSNLNPQQQKRVSFKRDTKKRSSKQRRKNRTKNATK